MRNDLNLEEIKSHDTFLKVLYLLQYNMLTNSLYIEGLYTHATLKLGFIYATRRKYTRFSR